MAKHKKGSTSLSKPAVLDDPLDDPKLDTIDEPQTEPEPDLMELDFIEPDEKPEIVLEQCPVVDSIESCEIDHETKVRCFRAMNQAFVTFPQDKKHIILSMWLDTVLQ